MAEEKGPELVVGGRCQYQSYSGQAEILSITKAPPEAAQGAGPRYEVRFSFYPDQPIEQDWVKLKGQVFTLTLPNGQLPDSAYLYKHGLFVGQKVGCRLEVIVKGTCTPTRFIWPSDEDS